MSLLGLKDLKNPEEVLAKFNMSGGYNRSPLTYLPSDVEEFCDGCDFTLEEIVDKFHNHPLEAFKFAQMHRLVLYRKFCDSCDNLCIVNLHRASYRCGRTKVGPNSLGQCKFSYGLFKNTVFEYCQTPMENILYLIYCYTNEKYAYANLNDLLGYPSHPFKQWRNKCDEACMYFCTQNGIDSSAADKHLPRDFFLTNCSPRPNANKFHEFLMLFAEIYNPYKYQRTNALYTTSLQKFRNDESTVICDPLISAKNVHEHDMVGHCIDLADTNEQLKFGEANFCQGCSNSSLQEIQEKLSDPEEFIEFCRSHRLILRNKMCSMCGSHATLNDRLTTYKCSQNIISHRRCFFYEGLYYGTFLSHVKRNRVKFMLFFFLLVTEDNPQDTTFSIIHLTKPSLAKYRKVANKILKYFCDKHGILLIGRHRDETRQKFFELYPNPADRFHIIINYASEIYCPYQHEVPYRVHCLNSNPSLGAVDSAMDLFDEGKVSSLDFNGFSSIDDSNSDSNELANINGKRNAAEELPNLKSKQGRPECTSSLNGESEDKHTDIKTDPAVLNICKALTSEKGMQSISDTIIKQEKEDYYPDLSNYESTQINANSRMIVMDDIILLEIEDDIEDEEEAAKD